MDEVQKDGLDGCKDVMMIILVGLISPIDLLESGLDDRLGWRWSEDDVERTDRLTAACRQADGESGEATI